MTGNIFHFANCQNNRPCRILQHFVVVLPKVPKMRRRPLRLREQAGNGWAQQEFLTGIFTPHQLSLTFKSMSTFIWAKITLS